MKTAVIFGVTGQDGSYLSELLLSKDYYVVGVSRRVSVPNDERIRHLRSNRRFELVTGDVTDTGSVYRILDRAGAGAPAEVYNLAAQSHVKVSFDEPAHTTDVTYKGCLNILEWLRGWLARNPGCAGPRFYQASSSEMFGCAYSEKEQGGQLWRCQDENTPFLPCSPYAVAKLAAHHAVRIYRESYGIFACSGILLNHESERRGEAFVTRKISQYVARLTADGDCPPKLKLGNLEACRDWGHAEDYVRGMWLMLQVGCADDYVLATGESHSVQEFLNLAFAEVGIAPELAKAFYCVDPELYRPYEVPFLCGDASKARRVLGWQPQVSFRELVRRMVAADRSIVCGS